MKATIQFKWRPDKAIQATAYLVGKLGKVDKIKLIKLLYIADRDHFLQHGAPITGDDQYALNKGPV
ncbi:MAG: SocA family protein, partial [Phycisphaerae bacterium]|nr:SocA family protein [Phycisphaerae bacterium]